MNEAPDPPDASDFYGYGNYCGPGQVSGAAPINGVDRCCMEHDQCYAAAGGLTGFVPCGEKSPARKKCDKQLVQCLDSLPAILSPAAMAARTAARTLFGRCNEPGGFYRLFQIPTNYVEDFIPDFNPGFGRGTGPGQWWSH